MHILTRLSTYLLSWLDKSNRETQFINLQYLVPSVYWISSVICLHVFKALGTLIKCLYYECCVQVLQVGHNIAGSREAACRFTDSFLFNNSPRVEDYLWSLVSASAQSAS